MARFGDLIGRTVRAVHIRPERNEVVLDVSGWFGRNYRFTGLQLTGETGYPEHLIDARISDCYCDEFSEGGIVSSDVVIHTDYDRVVFHFAGRVDID